MKNFNEINNIIFELFITNIELSDAKNDKFFDELKKYSEIYLFDKVYKNEN